MHCPVFTREPGQLQQRYVRELILVAERGGRDLRGLFLERYRGQLGCLPSWLSTSLTAAEVGELFRAAAATRRGELPAATLARRLAFPRWFTDRLDDPWAAWRLYAAYVPTDVAIDPVCHMFLDVADAECVLERMGERICFCCEHCRRSFSGERVDLAE